MKNEKNEKNKKKIQNFHFLKILSIAPGFVAIKGGTRPASGKGKIRKPGKSGKTPAKKNARARDWRRKPRFAHDAARRAQRLAARVARRRDGDACYARVCINEGR
jgi:hypothetical protein